MIFFFLLKTHFYKAILSLRIFFIFFYWSHIIDKLLVLTNRSALQKFFENTRVSEIKLSIFCDCQLLNQNIQNSTFEFWMWQNMLNLTSSKSRHKYGHYQKIIRLTRKDFFLFSSFFLLDNIINPRT